jgi:hypothetical protein
MSILPPEASISSYVEYGYSLGWSFTPLSGKRPTLPAWQKRPRESLADAIGYASRGNVGLRTGKPSGIVVVDVDAGGDTAPLSLPGTVTVDTGRDGIHLYYRCSKPLGNSAGKLGPHIDVKADGGQVVYPGSIHPDTGRRYEWHDGYAPWQVEIAELPEHIYQLLTEQPKPEASTVRQQRRLSKYVQAALDRELDTVRSAAAGERNNTLNTAAFNLGQLCPKYLDADAVTQALLDVVDAAGWDTTEVWRKQTEGTVRSGITSGMRNPRDIDARMSVPETPAPKQDTYILIPGPHVDEHGRYIEQGNDTFAEQVLSGLPEDAIYHKDYVAGEVLGEPGKRRWIEYTELRAMCVIDRHVKCGKWVKSRSSGEQAMIYTPISRQLAGVVLAGARQSSRIRDLNLMASYPIYGPGWLRVTPGWHGGVFYDEPADLQDLEPITDCETIYNVLHDLVVDFPFKTDADRQNFFGLLLTPIVAPALDGNRPLHLLLAPLERTGKTKLAEEVFGGVILGRQTPAMQIAERDEERDKRVIGLLLQGESIVHLDNLPPFVDSGTLASLLTATTYAGRLLGGNRMVNLPNNLTVVASGNNTQASGEIIKRAVPIVLQPRTAAPEARRDFQHPDLRAFVRGQRRAVLACLLGMVENWLAAGRPRHAAKMGGFENWSETVGAILQVNGLRAWRTNESDWRRQADPHGTEMLAFVETWWAYYKGNAEPLKTLLEMVKQCEMFEQITGKNSPGAVSTAFGKMLQRHVDAPVGEWFIRKHAYGNGHHYYLEPIDGTR